MKIPVDAAIHLLHEAQFVTLATLASQATQLPGYPYATPVPLVCDERHLPLLYVSALAEHTRNLLADGRASLSVIEGDGRAVQQSARLTLLGDFERFEPTPALQARYLRYLPSAADYLGLDFGFFRLRPKRLRFIGGIGQMGWIEADELTGPWLSPEEEADLLEAASQDLPAGCRLLGLDAWGIDYEIGGQRRRVRFGEPSSDPQALRESLAGLRSQTT